MLIDKPYLDRWYHVAIVRNGTNITGYVDGFQVFSEAVAVGTSATTDGVSVGGWGGSRPLYGEVQEVAIYQTALSQEFIVGNMFSDQPVSLASLASLVGYYKLGATNSLANTAQTPPTGTNPATAQGPVTFEATNQLGEQSAFDSRRNSGRDAIAPLSGAFAWDQTALSRPTPGVPFEMRCGYSSGNAFNSSTLGGFNPFNDSKLGSGWKHTFDVRIVPSQYFSPAGGLDSIGLMLWDGSLEVWDYDFFSDIYTSRHGEYRGEYRGEFCILNSSTCEWGTPDRLIYKFRHPFSGPTLMRGRLLEIRDFNGNTLTVNWDQTLGRVASVTDTSGGTWTFTYNAQDRLARVIGPATDPLAKWTVTFTYDAQNRLATKSIAGPAAYTATTPINTQWQFFYNATSGLLERIVDPRGKNDVRITYDTYGRKTQMRDALDRVSETKYGVDETNAVAQRKITRIDPAGKKWVESFDRRGRVEEKKDPLGNRTTFEHDTAGNVSAIVEPLGNSTAILTDWRTEFTYDDRANILTKKDALGRIWNWQYNATLTGGTPLNKPSKETRPATAEAPTGWETRYTYDGVGNLTKQDDDLGTLAEHTYGNVALAAAGFTAKGLALTSKDGNANRTDFTYDGNGFLASRKDAAHTATPFTWNFTRSELAWLLAESNPIPTETTTHQYDINGHLIASTDALTRTLRKTYDASGNLVSEKDAKQQETVHTYDDADQRTQTLDRAGKLWKQTFNSRGLLETTTDPDNKVWTRTYDDAGRLTAIADPPIDYGAGPVVVSVSSEYDANGNQTATLDKLGQRWKKEFDLLNRVTAEEDPLGDRKTTAFDAAGRVLTITDPRGFSAAHEYDGRSRLKKWTDPEGFAWIYTYDGAGNITDIEDALHGHYGMTYGPRNERLTESNQEQPPKTWTYTYDALLRLKTQTDPNATVRTLSYDHGGRMNGVAFTGGVSTGRSDALTLDDNNNPFTITRTVGAIATATALTYDAMDRVATSTDVFGKVVGYGYDSVGRVQTKTYPGGKVLTHGYDALSRLTSLSFAYAAGQTFATTFGYDKASRLTSRTYPNAIAETIGYDTAGRLSSLAYANTATAPIALGYAYDRNGNKTSSTEQGLLNWTPPAAFNETASFTPSRRLQTRLDAADPTHTRDFTYTYDASGNMRQAVSPGQSYALTYDEDNRVLTLAATGTVAQTIASRYDALGRRLARTLGATQTRYVLDLTGGMERILADTDSAGTVTAYYIHGPDLCFRVDAATGALTCYHADAQGNIVRTTDAARATTREYAYNPYGRLLGQTAAAPYDPYRFTGSQGVMEELPNLYFMRARYYSAEAGVFLSADPVKSIGPGWKPEAYGYAHGNPLTFGDPKGTSPLLLAVYYDSQAKSINDLLEYYEKDTEVFAGRLSSAGAERRKDEIVADYDAGGFLGDMQAAQLLEQGIGPMAEIAATRIGLSSAGTTIGLSYIVNTGVDLTNGKSLGQIAATRIPGIQIARTPYLIGEMVQNSYDGIVNRVGIYIGGTAYDLTHSSFTSSGGQSSGVKTAGQSLTSSSGGVASAASHANSLNYVQSTTANSTPMYVSNRVAPPTTSKQSNGDGAGVGRSVRNSISKTVQNISKTISSIVKSIGSIFRGRR